MNAIHGSFDNLIGTEIFQARTDDTLASLASDFVGALNSALWTLDFQGDLEEALDAALLRAALASTPTLSNDLFAVAAA